MRVIFFGTPTFAQDVLKELLESNIEVVAVVTKPDKPQKRSSAPLPPAVKVFVLENYSHIPVYQPIKASTPEFAEVLKAYNADLFVVVAYSEIIKKNLLEMPLKGCINVHGSALPYYRGAAPIQRALIAGEKESGITIIEMVKEMDAGPVLAIDSIPIAPEDTYGTLSAKLSKLGAKLLLNVIHQIETNSLVKYEQDHAKATFAPKMSTEDGLLNWSEPASVVFNRFRGTTPKPGAWCLYKVKSESKRLKILQAQLYRGGLNESEPGTMLITKEGPVVKCLEGGLLLIEVQPEGKNRMSGGDFIRGTPQCSFL